MIRRLKLCCIGSTCIYIHVASIVFYVYMLLVGKGKLLSASVVSVLLHEGAHAFSSALAGFGPSEIELTPLGALLRLEDKGAVPLFKQMIIDLAGPVMSLLLCVISLRLTSAGCIPSDAGQILFCCNLLMTVLNLLPVLPLDGGRMLAGVLGTLCREKTVAAVMRGLGCAVGLGLIAVNIIVAYRSGGWNLSLSLTGCFLLYAASRCTAKAAMDELRGMIDRKIRLEKRGHSRMYELVVMEDLPVHRAAALLRANRYAMLTVLQRGTLHPLAVFGEEVLIAACLNDPGATCSQAAEASADDCLFTHLPHA